MAQPHVFEGTPEELTQHISSLPKRRRYKVTIVPEGEDEHEFSDEGIAAADAALEKTIVSLGYPTGTDNEGIDADLARAYGAPRAPVNGKKP
ncbi:MAG TPA: hypothetical protein VFB38_00255 [Chthonomonadaceae bacterium]|nr:hypothetical protein [Chthonomonadaceae bacterium]